MEKKLKHLEFIQGIINRLSVNSFLLKGWAATIVSALFALLKEGTSANFLMITTFPVLIFWLLDGYFLHQERMFRNLYDKVRKLEEAEIDFSMNTKSFNRGKNKWLASMFSLTLITFYATILLIIAIVINFYIK